MEATDQIRACAEMVEPRIHIQAVTEDPADDRILECAGAADSNYLVTGDKHLLHLAQYQSVKIVTSAAFLQIVEIS